MSKRGSDDNDRFNIVLGGPVGKKRIVDFYKGGMVWLFKKGCEICETILVTSRMANMTYEVGLRKKDNKLKTNNKLLFGLSHVLKILSMIPHATSVGT